MAGCGEVDCSVNATSPSKLMEEVGDVPDQSGSPGVPPECAICLQSCVHPVRLPCLHVFCFLCVKGASWQSKRCALCRQEVPEDFLERPVLLSPEELKAAAAGVSRSGAAGSGSRGDHAWYYEGRNGWWQYDERTNRELEEAFAKERKSTEMLIAGFLYVADLENMVQYRRNEHGRRRKIKRDIVDIPKKGVAGLRLDPEPVPVLSGPVVAPAATERVNSADGSDAAGQSVSPFSGVAAALLPPVRPPTLLGRHPAAPLPPSQPSVEDSFSQLLIGQPEGDEAEGGDETIEYAAGGSGSGSEEELERESGGAESTRRLGQRPARESQPARTPPRGGPASAAPSLRSRSPDGQCTVTDV